jgi:hypothetical protein
MSILKVGNTEPFEVKWLRNGEPVTSGSATIRFYTHDGNSIVFLQSDLSSLSSTPHDHALALSGGQWVLNLTIPSSMKDRHITAFATHSELALQPTFQFNVAEASLDDIRSAVDDMEGGSGEPGGQDIPHLDFG